jgi:hypothetical protein
MTAQLPRSYNTPKGYYEAAFRPEIKRLHPEWSSSTASPHSPLSLLIAIRIHTKYIYMALEQSHDCGGQACTYLVNTNAVTLPVVDTSLIPHRPKGKNARLVHRREMPKVVAALTGAVAPVAPVAPVVPVSPVAPVAISPAVFGYGPIVGQGAGPVAPITPVLAMGNVAGQGTTPVAPAMPVLGLGTVVGQGIAPVAPVATVLGLGNIITQGTVPVAPVAPILEGWKILAQGTSPVAPIAPTSRPPSAPVTAPPRVNTTNLPFWPDPNDPKAIKGEIPKRVVDRTTEGGTSTMFNRLDHPRAAESRDLASTRIRRRSTMERRA